MSGAEDFPELTVFARPVSDEMRMPTLWDAYVSLGANQVILSRTASRTTESTPFDIDSAERLGRRLIAAAESARRRQAEMFDRP